MGVWGYPTLHVGGKDFLILKIALEPDAAGHDGGELNKIHKTVAGVAGEALSSNLFHDPSNTRS